MSCSVHVNGITVTGDVVYDVFLIGFRGLNVIFRTYTQFHFNEMK